MNDFSVSTKYQSLKKIPLTIMFIPIRPARRDSDEENDELE